MEEISWPPTGKWRDLEIGVELWKGPKSLLPPEGHHYHYGDRG